MKTILLVLILIFSNSYSFMTDDDDSCGNECNIPSATIIVSVLYVTTTAIASYVPMTFKDHTHDYSFSQAYLNTLGFGVAGLVIALNDAPELGLAILLSGYILGPTIEYQISKPNNLSLKLKPSVYKSTIEVSYHF